MGDDDRAAASGRDGGGGREVPGRRRAPGAVGAGGAQRGDQGTRRRGAGWTGAGGRRWSPVRMSLSRSARRTRRWTWPGRWPAFGGLYLDANAISPATAGEVAAIVAAGGAGFADGGIIGPPPVAPGLTRLYLSGPRAGEVQALFGGTDVDARVVPPPGSASAVKMAYASWTKGSAALLLAARALARAEGVEPVLLEEWGISQPGLEQRWDGAAAVGGGQGLALGGRDGGDRRGHGRGRAARGIPPGRGRDLPQVFSRGRGARIGSPPGRRCRRAPAAWCRGPGP